MAAPKNPLEAFVWGSGGAALTPEEIAKRRSVEDALLARGVDTSPVGHWTQGLARVANALGGSIRRGRLDDAESESNALGDDAYAKAITVLSGSPAASSMPTTTGAGDELAATSPAVAQPLDMSGNEVFGQFIDTVKQGGVQNPYALAAIAATGKAESGFDPKNATRTWSDPSESGQAGTAGGIMSWRGPRYQALAATGDLSPAGQAKFFLQENPQLIQSLNSAKSVEEAQSLMNNAWKFAGYDRPGGEASRRLQLASSFLPTFQGGGEVAAATPQAAIEAVAPASGYVDPMVSAPNAQPTAQTALAPELPPAVEVGPAPAVATVPQQRVAQALAGPQPQAPGINPAILQALSNPHMSQGQRSVVQALMQQDLQRQQAQQEMQMKQQDPRYQQQLELGEIELQNARNPQPKIPDSVQALNIRAQQAGLQPGTPEYQKFMLSGGDKGITINNEGTIPAGYQAVRDDQGRVTSIQPIPGSPAALEMEQALKARETQGGRRETATDVITNAASEARNLLKNGTLTTGTLGRLASNLTESDAAELRRQVGVLTSNATIENLTAMRQASPTGGALGSVTEKEGAMLAAAAGAIDPNAGKEQVEKALDNYEKTLLRVIHGPKVGDAIYEQTRQKQPTVIDGYQIEEVE